jgi:flavin reductase (DIM6/NTAB) family NADH-FMN oxidoreductase RutF
MDPQAKKEALRLFTYGLYAITCGDEARRNAFTANWVSQVSFEPPLVALSVENTSTSLGIIRETGRFAVNVFDATQRDLAGRLGKGYVAHPDKLEGLTWDVGEEGCPTLRETLGWVECVVESETPAGDSTLLIGRVVGARVLRREDPLTMFAAGFRHAG